MAFVNKMVRYLTKRHDMRNEKQSVVVNDKNVKLTAAEMVPSSMLAFNTIENKTDENQIIHILRKIFHKNESVKSQFGAAGENLLYCAFKLGRLKVAKFLMQQELNPCQVTSLGTVLHALLEAYAKRRISFEEFVDATEDVCIKGCDIDEVNYANMSPFLIAVELGYLNAVKMYVNLGCDYNVKDSSDNHALHIACRAETIHLDIVKYLLSLPGISHQTFNSKGHSPFFLVVKEYLECSKKFGKEVNFRRCQISMSDEKSMKACMRLLSVAETFLKAGVDPRVVSAGKDAIYLVSLLIIHRNTEMFQEPAHNSLVENDITGENLEQDSTQEHGCMQTDDAQLNMVPLTSQLICTAMVYGAMTNFTVEEFRRWSLRNYVTCDVPGIFQDPYIRRLVECEQERARDKRRGPLSLKILCRSTIRIEVANCGNLHNLDKLPLPRKLVDYTGLKIVM